MTVIAKLKHLMQRHMPNDDRLILFLAALLTLIGLVYIAVNQFFKDYPGVHYIAAKWLWFFPLIVVVYGVALFGRHMSPRMAEITRTYSLYYFVTIALGVLATGVQYTPFPLIDQWLVHLDQSMGYSTIAVLNWTYAHIWFQEVLAIAYMGLVVELFFVPVLLAIAKDRAGVNIYFVACFISYLIGTTLYYFFPTAGPTEVFHSPYFQVNQHITSLKFYQLHHYILPKTTLGGMIAFPSFHVIWSILLTYAVRRQKWLFAILAVFNSLVIASTLCLGWHYLTDVFGGIVVVTVSIIIAHYLLNRVS